MRYAPLSFSNACIAPIIQYLFPLVIGTSSLVYSDAPTSSTASIRSVTFGSKSSNFNVQSSIAQLCTGKLTASEADLLEFIC
jgi:hypothetical protein